ncbi:hypothetical protein Hbl1158_03400 [Halobaculum sp. CBA1158]|uniref:hypothetical protein n=1 Tax=Halobaculum sp. CBA1158 TaxID=2904243 RepID=UPI001F46E6B8|nr:hypothetical protein [Halobaculum sp. CBA1158]UIP00423.1 hypothetical protein Hbl1158_03400 [Halobaculum sp. CBA1158]
MNGSTTRQYGAAIAVASGAYSLLSAGIGGGTAGTGGMGGGGMGTGGMMGSTGLGIAGWLMLAIGVVVVVHGVVLLTPAADRLGTASGPLMIAYSLVMLLLQALGAAGVTGGMGTTGGMNGGMGTTSGMGSTATAGMGWDLGMVALAALMLFSGIVMTTRDGDDGGM